VTEGSLGTAGHGHVILVVDDDPVVRGLVCKMLSHKGYDTVQAASGEEAVVAFDRNLEKLSLVISDVIMPGMCGIQLARCLQQKAPSIPVLLMTAFVYIDLSSQFRNPPPVLSKPFSAAALYTKAEELMAARHPVDDSMNYVPLG
jgi:CheY-like chemotaxis protein